MGVREIPGVFLLINPKKSLDSLWFLGKKSIRIERFQQRG
jgi:hypothetical protein